MKTTKKIFAIAFLIMPGTFSFAQKTDIPFEPTPYIEVTGEAENEVVPDEIYLHFTLKEYYDGRNKIELYNLEKKLKQLIQKNQLGPENLSLADANADFITIKKKKKDVLASKDFIMKTTNTSELTKLLDILDEIDAQNAFIYRIDHSKMDELKKDVKIEAVKNAKEKATYLLNAIDEQTGKILFLQEREAYEPVYFMRNQVESAEMAAIADDAEQPGFEISFKKIKLKYKVFARFAIE